MNQISLENIQKECKDLLDKFNDFKITMITGNHDAWYKDTSEINSLSISRLKTNNPILFFKTLIKLV